MKKGRTIQQWAYFYGSLFNNFTQRYSELQPQKSNIIIEMVLVLQTYMLTVSFKILLIFWFLIRSNDSVAFHDSEMHSLHPICGSTRYE